MTKEESARLQPFEIQGGEAVDSRRFNALWNDWQVKPIGSPSICEVITVIPDA